MNPYLTIMEERILTALEKRPGRVVSRVQLSRDVYGHDYPDRSLDVHVNRIRKKLGRDAIVTMIGRGYILGQTQRCDHCEGRGWIGVE